MSIPLDAIGYAFLGGILPSLVWLYFLLKEDERCPEPRPLIVLAFVAGMLAVPLVLPVEQFAQAILPEGLPVIVAWATAEELFKYVLAAIVILWRRDVDESIDLVIYMLTVALGFAALENILFFAQTLANSGLFGAQGAIVTDNLRFVGSTLLHVIASSAIGFALAFSYRRTRIVRALSAAAGLILAIALHALFNFLIIQGDGSNALSAFFVVWTGVVVFLALFEMLKFLRYRTLPKNTC